MPCRRPQQPRARRPLGRRNTVQRVALLASVASAIALSTGCWEAATGEAPPTSQLNFPSGLTLDPRVSPDERARWLFVANANSDLVLNASSIVAVDLDAFHAAWQSETLDGDGEPILSGAAKANIAPPDSEVENVRGAGACRRNADRPQLIECLEDPFIEADATVYLTSFATVLRGYASGDKSRLLTPVRGDPSVSYVDIVGGLDGGGVRLQCGQGGDELSPLSCDGAYRLQHLFNDSELARIPLEPANIHVSTGPYHDDVAIVSHFRSPFLTLIDLSDTPVVVDISAELANAGANGGYGLAEWPCSEEAAPSFTRAERDKCVPQSCNTVDGCGVEGVFCGAGVCQAEPSRACSPADDDLCAAEDQLCILEGDMPSCVSAPSVCERDESCGVVGVECALPGGGSCRVPADIDPCDPAQEATAGCGGGETCVLDLVGAPTCVAASCSRDADCGVSGVLCEHASTCAIPQARTCDGDGGCGGGEQCVRGTACGRPLLYAAARELQGAVTFTSERVSAMDSQFCVDPSQLGEAGGLLCEQQLISDDVFAVGGYDVGSNPNFAVTGEMAFAPDGETLYLVQTNPGGLVRIDTSLDDKGRPKNLPAGVVEICAEPNAMTLFADETGEYAAVTCHRPALVFIVELRSFRVISNIIAGTGPHELVYDKPRGFLYVANSLGATISVIDVDNSRATRFTEVARIGLEDPYAS